MQTPYIQAGGDASAGGGGGGAAACAPKMATFQPSGPDVSAECNVFGTWSDVVAWITSTEGQKVVTIDDRYAPAVADVSVECDYSVQINGVIFANEPPVELSIADDVQIGNCTHFGPWIDVVGNRSLVGNLAPLRIDDVGGGRQTPLLFDRNAGMRNDGDFPMLETTAGEFLLVALYGGNIAFGTSPAIDVDAAATMFLVCLVSSAVAPDTISGSGFVGVVYNNLSASNGIGDQTLFGGFLAVIPTTANEVSNTISGGVYSIAPIAQVPFVQLRVSPEGGVADDLDAITPPTDYDRMIVLVRLEDFSPAVVTVRNLTGNISLTNGDCVLSGNGQYLALQYDGSSGLWIELFRSLQTGALGRFYIVGGQPQDFPSISDALTAASIATPGGTTAYIVLRPGTWALTALPVTTQNVVFLPWQHYSPNAANGNSSDTILDLSGASFAAPAADRYFVARGLGVIADGGATWDGTWLVEFIDCAFVDGGGAPAHQLILDTTSGNGALLLKGCSFLDLDVGTGSVFVITTLAGGNPPINVIDSRIDLNNLKSAVQAYLVECSGGSNVSFRGSSLRDFDSSGLVNWTFAGGDLEMTDAALESDTLPFGGFFTICGGVGAGDRFWAGCVISTRGTSGTPLNVGTIGSLDFGAPIIQCEQVLPIASPLSDAPPVGSIIVDRGTFNAARPSQSFQFDGNSVGYYPSVGGNGRSWDPVTLAAGNNNDVVGGFGLYTDLQSSSAVVATITGLEANPTGAQPAYDGQEIRFLNRTGNALTFTHQDALSTAQNRFVLPGAASFSLADNETATFKYFGNSALASGRWYLVSRT